eukprot:jgi/Chrzof1/5665/Cz16g10220.t1
MGAADTCANAVSDAFSQTCSKTNGVASVSLAAEICANAVAKVFVQTSIKMNSSDNAKACANACAVGHSLAGAVAAAAAQAIVGAAGACGTVVTFVKTRDFTSAFSTVTAKSLSNACTNDEGKAANKAAVMAEALANSYAKVLSTAMGKACSCTSCGCPAIGVGYNDTSFTDTTANVTSGKYALTEAVANAATTFCKGGSVQNALKTIVNALVKVSIKALNNFDVKTAATDSAFSCSMAQSTTAIRAVAEAAGDALAGAFAANFAAKCGAAVTAVKQAASASDTADLIIEAISASCSVPSAKKKGETVTATYGNVAQYVTRSPLGDAVQQSLATLLNTCECAGNCWCGTNCKDFLNTCPTFATS